MVDIANNAVAGITGYTDELYGFEADSSPIDTTMGVLIMADENQNGLIAVNFIPSIFGLRTGPLAVLLAKTSCLTD